MPFVLSQDDVCYYHYMDGDGFATKLVVDEDGKIRNEYVNDDGSVSVGDYDMVPLIDRFVEEHPYFSYRGGKGIVALTGSWEEHGITVSFRRKQFTRNTLSHIT